MSRLVKADLVDNSEPMQDTSNPVSNNSIQDNSPVSNENPVSNDSNNPTLDNGPQITDTELNTIMELLKRVDNSASDIKDAYYSLLDNLNALSKGYMNVYNEFKTLVKLPSDAEIKQVAQMKEDIDKALKYLNDKDFLSGIIK